jgi:nitrate reductase gamma subunit
MTWAVLWGIFPAILLGAFVSHLVYKWRLSPLRHFKKAQQAASEGRMQLETVAALKSIYR